MKQLLGKKFLLLFIVLLGCSSQEKNDVKIDDDNPVQKQHRIVSLGPYVTKQISLLGLEDSLVGCSSFCDKTISKNATVVGSLIDSDLEKVISLKPTIVFAVGLTRPKTIDKLKSFGIDIVRIHNPISFKMLCENFALISSKFKKEKLAKDIIDKAKKEVELIKKNLKKVDKAVFLQVGAKPIVTCGDNTLQHEFVSFAGGTNIFKGTKYGAISREAVIKENPDIIIITVMGFTAELEKKTWESYDILAASKNKSVYLMTPKISQKICAPTVSSFVETLKYFVDLIQPK